MQQASRLIASLACGLAIVSTACDSSTASSSQLPSMDLGTGVDIGADIAVAADVAECAFGQQFTIDATQLQNAYFPIHPGREWQLEGKKGSDFIQLTITVLNATQDIGGVTTRVIEERETVNDTVVEVSQNYFAENIAGAVCYFGEDVTIYLPGGGTSSEGTWRAGDVSPTDPVTRFHPGIIMPGDPSFKMSFQMEGAPGIAEDEGRIAGGGPVKVPAGTYTETLRVREFNPLDGHIGFKSYAKGVGLIIDGEVELTSCTVSCPILAASVASEGAPPIVFNTQLRSEIEVPACATESEGLAQIMVLQDGTIQSVVILNNKGNESVRFGHIHHLIPPATTGPVVWWLSSPVGTDLNLTDRHIDIRQAGIYSTTNGHFATAEAALAELLANPGDFYVNFHSDLCPGGFARGFLP